MLVAWNGPEIGEADEVLREALNLHISETKLGVHFKTNNMFMTVGPTVEKILKRKHKFNIFQICVFLIC